MIKMLKNNIKTITAFIIGLLVAGATVYAASIASSVVTYDNSTSHLKDSSNHDVTDVQAAIDALYEKINNGGGSGVLYLPSGYDLYSEEFIPYADYHQLIEDTGKALFNKLEDRTIQPCFYATTKDDTDKVICVHKDESDMAANKANLRSTFEEEFGNGSCQVYENNDLVCTNYGFGNGNEKDYKDCIYDNENEDWDCSESTYEDIYYNAYCMIYDYDGTFYCSTTNQDIGMDGYGYIYENSFITGG